MLFIIFFYYNGGKHNMYEARFTPTDGNTIMDNKYGFDMGLEEVCELLNEYEGIISSHNPNW